MKQDLCQLLFETTTAAMAVVQNGQFIQATPGVARLFGCPGDHLPGQSLLDFSPALQPGGESSAQRLTAKFNAAAQGQPQCFEWLCRRKNNEPFYVEIQLDAVLLQNETYFQLVLHDISQYKQSEKEARRETASRLQAFVNALPDVAFIYNADGVYLEILVSEDNTRYAGTADQFKGKYLYDVLPAEHAEQFLRVIRQVLQTQKPQVLEYSLKPGVWYEGRVLPLKTEAGTSDRVVWLARDITERKKLQSRIQDALARRERQIMLSTLVSQDAVAASNLKAFYQQVVARINEQFGLYHTQLLRLNADQETLELVSGYGEIGDRMLAEGFSLKTGEGLIGLAAGVGASFLQPDVTTDPFWKPHPLLPATKSELAIPIMRGSEISEAQITALQHFIRADFDGFIVNAFDPMIVADIARKALQQGKHVVAVGGDLGPKNQSSLIATREQQLGYILGLQAGEWAARHIPAGQTLKLGLLAYSQVSPQVIEREEAILDGIRDSFGDNFIMVEETAGDPIRGRAIAQTWLKEFPEMNMILGNNDGSALGAHQAVMAAGRDHPDKFFVGGIDAVPEALAAIKAGGAYQASVTQPPEEIGLLAVRTIVAAIKGLKFDPAPTIEYAPVNPANIDEILAQSKQWGENVSPDDMFAGLDLSDITVGISLLSLINPYYVRLVDAAQAEADRLGIKLVISDSRQVVGVLDVQARDSRQLTRDDQQMLEGLSRQIAAAIENVELFEEANTFRQFAEAAGQGLGMATLDGKVVYMNPALLQMVGEYNLINVAGKPLTDYYPEDRRQFVTDVVISTALKEGQWLGEVELQPVSGKKLPTIQNIFLIRDETGKPLYVASTVTDISEQKRTATELEARLQELAALQRIMSREGWKTYQSSQTEEVQGYIFADDIVRPLQFHQDTVEEKSVTENGHSVAKPMTVHGEVIGTLGIVDDPDHPLAAEDEAFLNSIAQQVAEALERARLLEQAHKRAVELEAVSQVGTVVSTVHNVEKLLQTVVDLTKSRFNLYHAHIYLLNDSGDTLNLAAGAGDVGRQMVKQGWHIERSKVDSIVAQAARTRQGVIANDVRQSPNFLPNPLLPDTRSELAVPLLTGDEVLGVLDVQSDVVNRFTEEDVHIQITLASQVAVALQNANLYQQTQLSLQETEMLYRVNRNLARLTEQQEMFEFALTEYLRQLNLEQGGVLIFNQNKTFGRLAALVVGGKLAEAGQRLPVKGNPPAQKVIATGQPVAVTDALHDPLLDEVRDLVDDFGYKSMLLVPIVVRGDVIGALGADSTETIHQFTPREIAVVQAIADQLGVAIERQRLLEETQAALDEVERTQRRYTVQAWEAYQARQVLPAYEHVREGVAPADNGLPAGVDQAVRSKKAVVVTAPASTGPGDGDSQSSPAQSNLLVPLTARNEVIGVLGLQEFAGDREWTSEEISLVETIAEEIAQAAESLRLLDETQLRAAREKRVNEISEKIQAAQSLEEALQIAVKEVGLSLQAAETSVNLEVE